MDASPTRFSRASCIGGGGEPLDRDPWQTLLEPIVWPPRRGCCRVTATGMAYPRIPFAEALPPESRPSIPIASQDPMHPFQSPFFPRPHDNVTDGHEAAKNPGEEARAGMAVRSAEMPRRDAKIPKVTQPGRSLVGLSHLYNPRNQENVERFVPHASMLANARMSRILRQRSSGLEHFAEAQRLGILVTFLPLFPGRVTSHAQMDAT